MKIGNNAYLTHIIPVRIEANLELNVTYFCTYVSKLAVTWFSGIMFSDFQLPVSIVTTSISSSLCCGQHLKTQQQLIVLLNVCISAIIIATAGTRARTQADRQFSDRYYLVTFCIGLNMYVYKDILYLFQYVHFTVALNVHSLSLKTRMHTTRTHSNIRINTSWYTTLF